MKLSKSDSRNDSSKSESNQEKTHSAESLGPLSIYGEFILLEPMRHEHAKELLEAGKEFDWAWITVKLDRLDNLESWIAEAVEAEKLGQEFPFIVREKSSGDIIGSTRYMDTQPRHKGTEIGWTWYSPKVWGTVVNPECKFLLLRHAFEDWGAIRVQLKTDEKNEHSRGAILKLGAKFEGTLRNHRVRADGTIRDTVMYSITREEWPEVKAFLERRISEYRKRESERRICIMRRGGKQRRRLSFLVIAAIILLTVIITGYYLYDSRPSAISFISTPEFSQFTTEYPTQTSSTAPNAIAVGANGDVWFSLWNLSSVGRLTPGNNTIHEYHIPGLKSGSMMTWGMAVDNDLKLLWLTEFTTNSIWSFNTSSLVFKQYSLKTPNSFPFGITIDKNHNVWFAEELGNKIGEISAQGSLVETSLPFSGSEPSGITTDSSGMVWFTLPGINSIGSYFEGKFDIQNLTGKMSTPVGIAVDSKGDVWLTQHGPSFITELNPQTHYLKTISTSNNSLIESLPYFCYVDQSGNVWFNEHQGNAMSEFNPNANSLIEYFIPSRVPSAGNISYMLTSALSPSGQPWYTELFTGKIGTVHSNSSFDEGLQILNLSESIATIANGSELSYKILLSNVSSIVYLNGYVGNFTDQGTFTFKFSQASGSGSFDTIVSIKNSGARSGVYFVTLTARSENVAVSKIIELRVP